MRSAARRRLVVWFGTVLAAGACGSPAPPHERARGPAVPASPQRAAAEPSGARAPAERADTPAVTPDPEVENDPGATLAPPIVEPDPVSPRNDAPRECTRHRVCEGVYAGPDLNACTEDRDCEIHSGITSCAWFTANRRAHRAVVRLLRRCRRDPDPPGQCLMEPIRLRCQSGCCAVDERDMLAE